MSDPLASPSVVNLSPRHAPRPTGRSGRSLLADDGRLRSPAQIPSPTQYKGRSIFPESPESASKRSGMGPPRGRGRDKLRARPNPTTPSSRSTREPMGQKNFDLSDWEFDLPAIAAPVDSTSPEGPWVRSPSFHHFPQVGSFPDANDSGLDVQTNFGAHPGTNENLAPHHRESCNSLYQRTAASSPGYRPLGHTRSRTSLSSFSSPQQPLPRASGGLFGLARSSVPPVSPHRLARSSVPPTSPQALKRSRASSTMATPGAKDRSRSDSPQPPPDFKESSPFLSTPTKERPKQFAEDMFDFKGSRENERGMPTGGRKAASMNNLFLASTASEPHTPIAARSTTKSHSFEGAHFLTNRKRNANGAMIVGGGGGGSKLAAFSPIFPSLDGSSPYTLRQGELANFDEDDDDDSSTGGGSDGGQEKSASLDPLPALTDSSSVDSSLESHADPVESLPGSGGAFFTPQNYKNVKPLQAAFMSTGLISKRLRHRTDSGVGAAPPFAARLEAEAANGVQKPTRLAHPAVAALGGRASLMPDTPCKRPAFVPSPAWRPPPDLHIVPPPQPEEGPETNSSSSAASSSSPTKAPVSPGPESRTRRSSPFKKALGSSHSSSSSSSTENSPTAPGKSGRPSLLKRRPLFRRRSSGHLSVHVDGVGSGSKLGAGRGGGYGEPVTPTRIGDRFADCEFPPYFQCCDY
jgi:hypothetical protein